MLTLTYRPGVEYSPRHVSDCIKRLRHWAKRKGLAGLRYVWVAELQQRGAVHYHLAVWLPYGVTLPKVDAEGWWPYGMSQREPARHAVAYLMKYLSKGGDYGRLPLGARAYGVGGLSADAADVRGWYRLPGFLRVALPYSERRSVGRAVGGGWVRGSDGAWWPSEFTCAFGRHRDGTPWRKLARINRNQLAGALPAELCGGPWSRWAA